MANEPNTSFLEHPVVDEHGQSIGKVVDVVFDRSSGDPRWAVVKPGVLRKGRYVPIEGAYRTDDGEIVVPYAKQLVASAPAAASDHVLSDEEERTLRRYYGN